MCGICGKLNFDRQNPVDLALLRRMMDLMHHRGPDGSGELLSGPVGLGHRRLSIIDLAGGGQPMSNEDGTVWVVYNGEIYNFQELRSELARLGHRFKSKSDTEVIVHLYEEVGDECVGRLRGMFSFALWDERQQRLLLARDRVGVKPLYYANTGSGLVFASEIKSILADPSVARRVNPRAIDRLLTYYYLPGNETLFDGVFKLDPGHYMTVEDARVSVHKYWDLHFDIQKQWDFDDAVHVLRGLLKKTVKDHMISDVPVGILLSGGVDSTAVLSHAVEETNKPIHTFTVGFSGHNFADERPYATLAAKRFGTVHHEISMDADDFRDFLPGYVWHMEEPVCEPPAVALYFVSKLARDAGIKVLLSGEGGDEAFGGYSNYRNLLTLERLKSTFGPAKGALRLAFRALEKAGWKRIGPYAGLVDVPLAEYYLSRTATPGTPFNRSKAFLYSKDFAATLAADACESPTRQLFEQMNHASVLDRMLYIDTKTWLPDDLLVKADKMTMATSVELRVPLLDFQILEFSASLPQHYKVQGWKLKRILKAALDSSIPDEIIKRKKTGFPVPYDRWMRHDMKEYVFDTLTGAKTSVEAYFSKKAITELLTSYQQGAAYSKEVFSLIVLELLHQQFLENRQLVGAC